MDKKIDKFLQNVPEADQLILRQVLESLTSLTNGSSDICPHCSQPIEEMKRVGRSVYGSCGHRLYQGHIPTNLKRNN